MTGSSIVIYASGIPRLLVFAINLNEDPFLDESPFRHTVSQSGTALVTLTPTASADGSGTIKKFATFGVNTFLTIPSPLMCLPLSFLIHGWARPNATATDENGRYRFNTILSLGLYTDGIMLRLGDGGGFSGNGTLWVNGEPFSVMDAWFPVNTWTYFAITRNSTGLRFYTRSVGDNSNGHTGTPASAHLRVSAPNLVNVINVARGQLMIGQASHKSGTADPGGWENFCGELDRIAIITNGFLNNTVVPMTAD